MRRETNLPLILPVFMASVFKAESTLDHVVSSVIKVILETSNVYNICELVRNVTRRRVFGSLRESTIYTLASYVVWEHLLCKSLRHSQKRTQSMETMYE